MMFRNDFDVNLEESSRREYDEEYLFNFAFGDIEWDTEEDFSPPDSRE